MKCFDWNKVLKLPAEALVGNRRIPKTMLVRHSLLTKAEQKTLDKVIRLDHFASVQKSTTKIPPYIDLQRDVQCIVFIHCQMGDSHAYMEVGRLLHKCFPNPTVILFDDIDHLCISAATTRRSLAEKGATVLDSVDSTGSFYKEDKQFVPFLNSMAFNMLPQDNLQVFAEGITWNVKLSHAIRPIGFFPTCPADKRARLGNLLEKQELFSKEVDTISQTRRMNKELTLNESAHLRMRLIQLENELGGIVDEMKEICGD